MHKYACKHRRVQSAVFLAINFRYFTSWQEIKQSRLLAHKTRGSSLWNKNLKKWQLSHLFQMTQDLHTCNSSRKLKKECFLLFLNNKQEAFSESRSLFKLGWYKTIYKRQFHLPLCATWNKSSCILVNSDDVSEPSE